MQISPITTNMPNIIKSNISKKTANKASVLLTASGIAAILPANDFLKQTGKDKLELPKLINEEYKNKKFYVIDDIYATGNTMKAIIQAIQEIGGIIKGQGVIMNIKELNNDNVFSLLDVNEE